MVKIIDYNEINVQLLRSTEKPEEILAVALDLPMCKTPKWVNLLKEKLERVISAGHTSCLEFIDYTFLISGVSKSIVGQLTRHRIASFSSTSQHYQLFSSNGFTLNKKYLSISGGKFLSDAEKLYDEMISTGVPKEEARQYLPTSSSQSILLKINARSLSNLFSLRLCGRNCLEFIIIAQKMRKLVEKHYPGLWQITGYPDCVFNKCKQGKMSCGKRYIINE